MEQCRPLRLHNKEEPRREEFEMYLKMLHERGQFREAVTLILKRYGHDMYLFSLSIFNNNDDAAAEAYSQACLDLWMGIDKFRWASSMRTWVFKVTHSACCRQYQKLKNDLKKRNKVIAFSAAFRPANQLRTQTRPYFKTEKKCAISALRKELSQYEQTLLFLRIDQCMPWRDIASIMSNIPSTESEILERVIPTYRKRFERIVNRLRKLAEETGLLEDGDSISYASSYQLVS